MAGLGAGPGRRQVKEGLVMTSRLPPAPLREGDRVRFLPGSPPYLEGWREGVVVSTTTGWAEHVRQRAARTGEDHSGMLEGCDEGLELPVVEAAPCPRLPLGLAFPCSPLFVERLPGPPPHATN